MRSDEVISWFERHAKPFLEKHAPDRLEALKADHERLKRLQAKSDEVTVCFLGNSGVGKSTLLNALAAGDKQILPAGGIGPLTAQATEVRYSDERRFRVVYHPRRRLWNLAFALEARLRAERRAAGRQLSASVPTSAGEAEDPPSDLIAELTQEDVAESLTAAQLVPPQTDAGAEEQGKDSMEGLIKQAKNVVCGNQFAERPLEYLVDALRLACGQKPAWGSTIEASDQARVSRVQKILKEAKADRIYERREGDNLRGFQEDMSAHAAGFLSPLIERIEVGWPSQLLKSGVVLVDLPGVGIAQDAYRDVTKSYVRDKARAVIVTVDRAGPTESTVDLLRTSGYWERLVGTADDPGSDACAMLIAVTRVDDVTQTEWQNQLSGLEPGAPKPKKREVFARLVEEFKPRMKAQIVEQLGKIGDSSNVSVNAARAQARQSILDGLEIHPVSAPELRKILAADEDDRPFLGDKEQTGVPQLQRSLAALAKAEKDARRALVEEVSQRLSATALSEIRVIEASWQQENRAAEEAERLAEALAPVLRDKKEEYRARAAAFREFLEETVQAKIEALVLEARTVAEDEVNSYLSGLRSAHWATLRAAVRRGGTFYGSWHISLPDDITGRFQEPMAAVWGQKLLRDIRKRTTELANDTVQMVQELCQWAHEHGGAAVNKQLLSAQEERIAALADQMKTVGKEAVDELRETVKNELSATIRKPIKNACEKFVRDGDDIGPGVKWRILELFNKLARTATEAAREPAIRILKENAASVRKDIQTELKKGGNPLQDTADLIVESHEAKVRRSDAQRRGTVLREAQAVLGDFPGAVVGLEGASKARQG
jgi:GTP-binding protein EngB required for normal cell division